MSDRRNPRQSKKSFVRTQDTYQNFVARVGMGTGNQNDGGHYGFRPVSRNRIEMEYAYRGSWIVGRIIDVVAQDMTREGVEINTTDDPDTISEFEKTVKNLRVWDALCQTIKWSRLYGGSLAFLMIDGQNPATPLRLETIGKGQFKGLLPMDRWLVTPSLSNLVTEFGPSFGKPVYYDTVPDISGMPRMTIHHSRVIRLEGVELPYWQRIAENLWGQSVLERLWDRLVSYDSTTMGVAQLVYKAHLRTVSIENLREIVAAGGAAVNGVIAQIAAMRALQTNEGITLLDSKDKFETHQYAFSGLDAILAQFGEQLAGACEIPLVRLFGQSPAGFSTGDHDLRAYYDSIKQRQVSTLGPSIDMLYRIIYVSTFGKEPPKVFDIQWRSLWVMDDVQKAQVTNQVTASLVAAYESGALPKPVMLKELKQLGKITGVYSNISDDDIKDAEDEPPPIPVLTTEIGPDGKPKTRPGAAPEAEQQSKKPPPGMTVQ